MDSSLSSYVWILKFNGEPCEQARFPPSQPAIFKHLASDALLRVRLFDGEPSGMPWSAGHLKPKKLLGEMTFSVSHIEVSLDPLRPLLPRRLSCAI